MFFLAKTTEGYVFKILSELLQANMKHVCFNISKEGIKMGIIDHSERTMFDLNLDADNFITYKFEGVIPINIGINLKHFHKMLKSMKKKDSIELYIEEQESTNFNIRVIPVGNNRISTSSIRIHTHQTIDMEIPEGYKRPVIVFSSDFQKMIKDLRAISDIVNFKAYESRVVFKCSVDNVFSKDIVFGDNIEDEKCKLEENFDINQLLAIIKIGGLTKSIQIFSKPGSAVMLKAMVGTLGTLCVYTKGEQLLLMENETCANEMENSRLHCKLDSIYNFGN